MFSVQKFLDDKNDLVDKSPLGRKKSKFTPMLSTYHEQGEERKKKI